MTANILGAVAAIIIFVFIFSLLRRGVLQARSTPCCGCSSRGRRCSSPCSRARSSGSASRSASRRRSNLLFFVTVVLLVLVSVQLSYELSRHEARIRRLAEEVALLRPASSSELRESRDDD